MREHRKVVRTIETARYRVEVFVVPEDSDPADSIALGDSPEEQEAEREWIRKTREGFLPWVMIGVEVSVKTATQCHVIGADFLGGCDCLPFDGSDYGNQTGRDMIRQAIQDARATQRAMCSKSTSN
jgi:hypothetical protein